MRLKKKEHSINIMEIDNRRGKKIQFTLLTSSCINRLLSINMWLWFMALYTEQKYLSLCVSWLYKHLWNWKKSYFWKGGGWSSDHHSFSMTLTVAANKIHGLMSNVGRKDVRIFWILQNGKKSNRLLPPPTQFWLKTLKSSVAYIHLQ